MMDSVFEGVASAFQGVVNGAALLPLLAAFSVEISALLVVRCWPGLCWKTCYRLGGREGRCLNYAVKSGSVDTMHYTLLCLTIKIVVHIEWGQGGAIRWSPGQ